MTSTSQTNQKQFAIAPMMAWTDRHCRVFHRTLTKRALLFTEMVTSGAVIHGNREKILGFSQIEHPVVCQIGGSNPAELVESAKIIENYGYDEINLNVGCPSNRVQNGSFGACLMKTPELVGKCVAAMKKAVKIPVTVKCRLGVDDQNTETALNEFTDAVISEGVDGIWVHARKALLDGLSPKKNREVPALDYERVYRLKARLPDVFIGINGGIETIAECQMHLNEVDAVMVGRAAYQNPWMLSEVDEIIYGEKTKNSKRESVIEEFSNYIGDQLIQGERLCSLTKHILGLYHGRPGARSWRRILTTKSILSSAGLEIIESAMNEVDNTVVLNDQFSDQRVPLEYAA